jgi:hypothetical protein
MAITIYIGPAVRIPNPGASNGSDYTANSYGWTSVPDVASVRPLVDCGMALLIPQLPAVPSAGRPTTNLAIGMTIFDTTLNKPIWLKSLTPTWVDATGGTV